MGKRICVFISGSGTNFQALIDATKSGNLNCEIGLLVSNKQDAYGIKRAEENGIPVLVQTLKQYKEKGKTRLEFDLDLAEKVLKHFNGAPDLIVLAGFMHILSADFLNKFPVDSVINLHPALPGAFDGARAIPRAFEAFQKGDIEHTGVMIHRCIPEVDRGAVIVKEVCPILKTDTLESLEERIHSIEHKLIVQGTDLALMLQDQPLE
jgi:phosphoribosylglycinamide formyltransferase